METTPLGSETVRTSFSRASDADAQVLLANSELSVDAFSPNLRAPTRIPPREHVRTRGRPSPASGPPRRIPLSCRRPPWRALHCPIEVRPSKSVASPLLCRNPVDRPSADVQAAEQFAIGIDNDLEILVAHPNLVRHLDVYVMSRHMRFLSGHWTGCQLWRRSRGLKTELRETGGGEVAVEREG